MTDREKAIKWFENIAEECDKLTSGNVAHLRAQIKGMAIRSAEYLKKQEPVSEDSEQAAEKYARAEYNRKNPAILPERCRGCYAPIKYGFKAGAQWQRDQMMKNAVEAVVSQVPCANEIILRNPSSVSYWYLPSEMNRLGVNKGDRIKVIIIKG